jgi:His/Glu/Gln/Arg/opine family amino acid ABC transporter permease subunit
MAAMLGLTGPFGGPVGRGLVQLTAGGLAATLLLPFAAPLLAALGGSLDGLAASFARGRAEIGVIVAALSAGWLVGNRLFARLPAHSRARGRFLRALSALWLVALVAAAVLLLGVPAGPAEVDAAGGPPLPPVPSRVWGGLLLTLVLAVVSIALSFPLGVLLALGRRSSLPLVRVVSVGYIELIRGVPLVTVLYSAALMLPLLMPAGMRPAEVVRAIAGLSFFSAAYVAEDVRGGLAAVGAGQYDAARALGLGTASTYRLVVLPQALRAVIPSLVGQFISLFKDTSLAYVIGLQELLRIALIVANQPAWLGRYREVLVYIAVLYFVFSYAMSRASRQVEARLRPRAA